MRRVALIVLAVLVLLLAGSQLLLPSVAEDRIRSDLAETGEVRRVEVSAFPALGLLAGRADRVEVEMGRARAVGGRLAGLVEDARGVEELDASVASLQLGRLAVEDVRLVKRGDELEGRARLTDAALAAALPDSVDFRPVDSGGEDLVLEATIGLFGIGTTVRARLTARNGGLVVAPEGVPFGGLATITVFQDPRVSISRVRARRLADGYALTATGRLAPG